MADNYLEKRMDDYARGRLCAQRTAGTTATRSGFKYPSLTVFVTPGSSECARSVISAFVEAGCRVCFDGCAMTQGNRMAQNTGARFYNLAPDGIVAHLQSRGEHIDVLVELDGCDASTLRSVLCPDKTVSVSGQSARGAAIMALALAHPEVKT